MDRHERCGLVPICGAGEGLRILFKGREFYGANKKRNYVNVGVNMDVERQALVDYTDLIRKTIPADQHFPIAWRNAKGHSDNFGAIKSEPTHFVLDKEHKLVLRRNGIFKPTDWDDLWTSLG